MGLMPMEPSEPFSASEGAVAEFVPLRKRAKLSNHDEVENNYIPSYYNPAAEVLQRSPEEVAEIRSQAKITVRIYYSDLVGCSIWTTTDNPWRFCFTSPIRKFPKNSFYLRRAGEWRGASFSNQQLGGSWFASGNRLETLLLRIQCMYMIIRRSL